MMFLILSALAMGAIGSLHCIGMCGPIALSLPLGDSNQKRFAGTLVYNIGRAITYSSLGILFGLVGSSFKLFGLQQGLSIGIGLLIIAYLLIPKSVLFKAPDKSIQSWFAIIRQKLSTQFKKKNFLSNFYIGILNGFLPCGLVYMAIAVAIASASVWKSAMFMFFFGMGTLPLMWSLSFFGSFFSLKVRTKIRKAYPYMMAFTAGLLIIRGLGLGIPYLSPSASMHVENIAVQCHPAK